MNRADYMDGRVSHEDYYYHLATVIGIGAMRQAVLMVASLERIREALTTDEHLNNIPLARWDGLDAYVRSVVSDNARAVMAVSWTGTLPPKTFCWSRSETVCVLKAVARVMAQEASE